MANELMHEDLIQVRKALIKRPKERKRKAISVKVYLLEDLKKLGDKKG